MNPPNGSPVDELPVEDEVESGTAVVVVPDAEGWGLGGEPGPDDDPVDADPALAPSPLFSSAETAGPHAMAPSARTPKSCLTKQY